MRKSPIELTEGIFKCIIWQMFEAFYEGIKQIRVEGGPSNAQRAEANSLVHVESRIKPVAVVGVFSTSQPRYEHQAIELAGRHGRFSSDAFGKLVGGILASVSGYEPWVLNMAQLSEYWEIERLVDIAGDNRAKVQIRAYTNRDRATHHGTEIIVPTALPSRGFLRFVTHHDTYLMKVITYDELGGEAARFYAASLPRIPEQDIQFFGGAVQALAQTVGASPVA